MNDYPRYGSERRQQDYGVFQLGKRITIPTIHSLKTPWEVALRSRDNDQTTLVNWCTSGESQKVGAVARVSNCMPIHYRGEEELCIVP